MKIYGMSKEDQKRKINFTKKEEICFIQFFLESTNDLRFRNDKI